MDSVDLVQRYSDAGGDGWFAVDVVVVVVVVVVMVMMVVEIVVVMMMVVLGIVSGISGRSDDGRGY